MDCSIWYDAADGRYVTERKHSAGKGSVSGRDEAFNHSTGSTTLSFSGLLPKPQQPWTRHNAAKSVPFPYRFPLANTPTDNLPPRSAPQQHNLHRNDHQLPAATPPHHPVPFVRRILACTSFLSRWLYETLADG